VKGQTSGKREVGKLNSSCRQPTLSANAGISGVPTSQSASHRGKAAIPDHTEIDPPLVVVQQAEARLPSEMIKDPA